MSYDYDTMLKNDDVDTVKSLLYKSILKLCYDPKNGLYYFCKFIIGDLLYVGFPNPFRYNKLFRTWDKLAKRHKKISVQCFRGGGKSLFFTQLINIYDMFLFKHRKIIIISASQEQANSRLEELKAIIENNEWLLTKRDPNKWAKETIGYNEGYILVAGIGSEILGQHIDRAVVDDVLRSDNKMSDQEIEDYIDMNLDPMLLNRNGQMILVGTPRREADVFNAIEYRKKEDPNCPWIIKKYPAILDYKKKILQCPDRFTWEAIMEKRLSMGPLKFAREYQLEFFSRDTSLFPRHIVDPAKKKGLELTLLNKADKRSPNWTWVIGVDVARSGSISADYTVAIVLAYDTITQAKQIVHMWRSKGLKITLQAEKIAELAKKFNNCMCVVETNNMGQDMVDSLVDDHNVYVEPITVTAGKSKEELVRFLITSFENEQIIIPRGDEYTRKQMDILEDELAKYCVTRTPSGNEKFEGVGSHDDSFCEETSILLKNGTIKNIEDVKPGEYVLTHLGNYKEVISTMSKESKKKIITIKPYGGLPINLTDNHKIFVILKPRKHYLHRKRIKKLEFKEELSQNISKKKHLLLTPINRDIEKKEFIDLKNYIPTTKGWVYNDKEIWNYRHAEKKYKRKIPINKNFCFFIGHFAGDGYNGGSIAFNKNNTKLIEKIRTYLESLGINVRNRYTKGNSLALEFCCIPLLNFLKQNCKKYIDKQIPDFCMKLHPKLQKEIFEGYRNADGCVLREQIMTASISKKLVYQMKLILLRNNIVASLRELKRQRYGIPTLNQFWLELNKNETYKYLYGKSHYKYDQSRSFIFDDYLLSTIKDIKYDTKISNLYDLQVKDDLSFVAEGISVRNCPIALALANKGTQIGGIPFAVSNEAKGYDVFNSLTGSYDKNESDLVKQIKMGILK